MRETITISKREKNSLRWIHYTQDGEKAACGIERKPPRLPATMVKSIARVNCVKCQEAITKMLDAQEGAA